MHTLKRTSRILTALMLATILVGVIPNSDWQRIPTSSAQGTGSPYDDEFNGPDLNSRWAWLNEDPTRWSLTDVPGNLRIISTIGDMRKACSTQAKNVLLQEAPPGNFEIQTKLVMNPTANYQLGGLVIFNDVDHYVKLNVAWNGPQYGGQGVEIMAIENGQVPSNRPWFRVDMNYPAFLRLVKSGNLYTGYYSSDGELWQLVGSVATTAIPNPRIGVLAFNSCFGNPPDIPADFDYFRTSVGSIDDSRPTPFLHLPFDHEDTWEYYNTVLQNWHENGLLYSWVDHMHPDSSAYNSGDGVVLYDGRGLTDGPHWSNGVPCYKPADQRNGDFHYCYDGHAGLDFVNVGNEIHPADDGVIEVKEAPCHSGCVYGSCDYCGPLGNHVIVYHSVDQGNGYFTFYAHMAAGTVTAKGEGDSISTHEVVGHVGSTGRGGHHLHFGVYRDNNDSGRWDGSAVDKVVDPFGWMPREGADYTEDPWVVDAGMNGRVSHYLWVYDVREGLPNASGDQGLSYTSSSLPLTLAADPGAFLGQALFELSSEPPEAMLSAQLRSVFHPWWLRLLEWIFSGGTFSLSMVGAQDASEFALSKPITFTLTYPSANTRHLNTSQIVLYRWDQDQAAWQPLPTQVDAQNNVATASTYELGNFHLQAPLICPADESEIDDTFYSAKGMATDGTPASRLFDISDDEDWFWFSATQGFTYTLQTSSLAAGVDTVVEVYNLDSVTLLASDDNSGGGAASWLEWQAPLAGTYFLRVAQAPGSAYGCDAAYELSVSQEGGPLVYLPIIMKNH